MEHPIYTKFNIYACIATLNNTTKNYRHELFKAGGDELVRCMHHLLYDIWSLESMPSDWSLSSAQYLKRAMLQSAAIFTA